MINIFTCECLMEHQVRMSYSEIEECIMNYVIFSLINKWLLFIHTDEDIYFFCIDAIHIIRVFTHEEVFCIRRSGFCDDTCLDLCDFSGINNCCENCLSILTDSLKKYLIKLRK